MEQAQTDDAGIGFQVSQQTVQAETAMTVTLEENIKRTMKATHLQCKQEQLNVNLALFGMMKQWVQLLMGDVLRFVVMQGDDEAQIVVGLPDEDVDAFISTLESVMEDVEAISKEVGTKGKTGTKVAELTLRIKNRLTELAEAISDAALGEALEGVDEDFIIEEDDEDEEPLITTEPEASQEEVQP